MRVAIVAESFLPIVNGVVNSVLRVLEYLRREGHEAIVIAPQPREGFIDSHYEGFRIARVPAVDLPMINSLPIGVPLPRVYKEIRDFQPDVVHLASPFVLGGAGVFAARALHIPCVAVYQTDVPGYTDHYNLKALHKMSWRWVRTMHNNSTLTLAPSSVTIEELEWNDVRNVHHWGRGVDTERFNPSKRDEQLRAEWLAAGAAKRGEAEVAGAGEAAGVGAGGGADAGTGAEAGGGAIDPTQRAGSRRIVGFVGRLAAEKSVDLLAALDGRDDVQLVIVGDGPDRAELERLMPTAVFAGALYGEELAIAFASLDVFVHAGAHETFCQAIQEAQASGLPTIGPRAGGPIDLIDDGHTGFLLNPATFARDLPSAIDHIISSDANLGAFGAASLARVQDRTWPALCEQLMGYYEQAILAGPAAARVGVFVGAGGGAGLGGAGGGVAGDVGADDAAWGSISARKLR